MALECAWSVSPAGGFAAMFTRYHVTSTEDLTEGMRRLETFVSAATAPLNAPRRGATKSSPTVNLQSPRPGARNALWRTGRRAAWPTPRNDAQLSFPGVGPHDQVPTHSTNARASLRGRSKRDLFRVSDLYLEHETDWADLAALAR